MSHVEWHIIRILCDENGMLPERVSYSYLVEDICILSSAIRNYVLTRNQRRKNVIKRWSHFLRQPAKVDSPMQRTNHHEDAETVFG